MLLFADASATLRVSPTRVPLETGCTIVFTATADEPKFDSSVDYQCQTGRHKQFSLHIPPQNYHSTGVHSYAPATVLSPTSVRSYCWEHGRLHLPSQHEPHWQADFCGENATWAPGFIDHFPLFAPAFSSRPYIRETNGHGGTSRTASDAHGTD